jgi:hypothetical protein
MQLIMKLSRTNECSYILTPVDSIEQSPDRERRSVHVPTHTLAVPRYL